MRTFTLAEAARLVGTSRGTLYRHIKRGRLGYEAAGGPGKSGVITEEALRQAGFQVPPDVEHLGRLPDVRRTSPATLHEMLPDAYRLQTLEQRVEHLERYTGRLERELDLALDLLKAIASQQGSRDVVPASRLPPTRMPPRSLGQSGVKSLAPVRQQIVELLRHHPAGLSPAEARQRLTSEKDLGDTMKGMARDGLLTRLGTGRYGVAEGVAEGLREKQ
jgi:excisionase family DNA binding protein